MGKQYQIGDTAFIALKHQTYNFVTDAWALADPDTNFPKITIVDPDGTTQVSAVGMTSVATGKFQYQYTIPAASTLGWWRGYIDVENGSYPDREYFGFLLEE